MPESDNWVKALAMKYRGAIYAAVGRVKEAEKDFMRSCSDLINSESPLLGFIGATVALQAAVSLHYRNPTVSNSFAKQALTSFQTMKSILYGTHRDPNWIRWSKALAFGTTTPGGENPQIVYRY